MENPWNAVMDEALASAERLLRQEPTAETIALVSALLNAAEMAQLSAHEYEVNHPAPRPVL